MKSIGLFTHPLKIRLNHNNTNLQNKSIVRTQFLDFKKQFLFVILLIFVSVCGKATVTERVGWWKFDNPADLMEATLGGALELTGTIDATDGPTIDNDAVVVGKGSYLTAYHGIFPNGDGELVNEYSIQIDFSITPLGLWHAIFQTTDNADDAELFINTSNFIGAWRYGYSTNAIEDDTWYRMIVTVKNGEFYRIYINGELWVDGTGQDIDSRDALGEQMMFFADNDGEDEAINCSEIGIWDVALTAEEVTELGDATVSPVGNLLIYGSNTNTVLGKCYPNPASGITSFDYSISEPGNVALKIFNASGQMVQEIYAGKQSKGAHKLTLNTDNLNNGLYFVQLSHNNRMSCQKMVVLK